MEKCDNPVSTESRRALILWKWRVDSSYQLTTFKPFEVLRVGRRWNGSGGRISDFHCMTSNWYVDYSMSSLLIIVFSAFLPPHMNGMLQFGFWVREWLYPFLFTMTGQFVGLCVSVMLGMRVSSLEWRARRMLSGCKRDGSCRLLSAFLSSLPSNAFAVLL